jgi:penicillin G amidase
VRRTRPSRGVQLLFSASTVSGLGDGTRVSALAILAAALTTNTVLVASVTVASQLPVVLVGPFTGVLADHIDRRRALWICDVARLAPLAVLILLIERELVSIPVLIVVTFVLSSIETLAFTIVQAIVPELADPERLDAVNARLQAGPFVTRQLLGAPLGAVLFVLSRALPFVVDAFSFALSAVLVSAIRRSPSRTERTDGLDLRILRDQTTEGFQWLWRSRPLRAICALMAMSNVAMLGVLAIAVLYVLEELHKSEVVYGLLLGVVAVGGLIGLALSAPLAKRLGPWRTLQVTFAACPVPFLIGGLTSSAWVAAAAFALVAATVSITTVVSATLRQTLIPTDVFGRVNGAFWLVVGGAEPLGGMIGGLTADWLGLRAPFFVAAGLLLVTTVAAIPLLSGQSVAPVTEAIPVTTTPAVAADDGTRASVFHRTALAVAAAVAAVALMLFLADGMGPVPALGTVLNPGGGVWNSAAGAVAPADQSLRIPGLHAPATVSFSSAGIASIRAATDDDLFLALGYVHAKYRFSQMDLERRLGEGRLAQLTGSGSVASDTFELQLGLLRTARAEWAAMPAASPARAALTAYAAGVNDWLRWARANGQIPVLYTLAGVAPAPWTPVDSLAVQEVLTQDLDFTTTPLDYAVLERTLGEQRTASWFPELPPDEQQPFDAGPYRDLGLAPLAVRDANAAVPGPVQGNRAGDASTSTPGTADGAAALLARIDHLPASAVHRYPDSNAWAANGPAVRGGRAILAGDPHLAESMPDYWYEVSLSSPGYDAAGASLPGVPGILIGKNAHVSWSITNTENQSTLFYTERTSAAHPGEYFWRGQWRPMTRVRYVIPVRGAAAVRLTVSLTVHGPVMNQDGSTDSVDWMGNYPSDDVSAMLELDRAANFAQFKQALRGWYAPTLNFVYADDQGNIGVIAPGYYPQVSCPRPWFPQPGTGQCDVTGVIPYAAVPQSYNPPDHVVVTANQRPVGARYPYYVGTTLDNFDYGYRADLIHDVVTGGPPSSMGTFEALQNNVTDRLATLVVPRLLAALGRQPGLTPTERAALSVLSGWDDAMTTSSAGASIWWTFWSDYLQVVFQPWWSDARVPTRLDPSGLTLSTDLPSLDQDLETWTLSDPGNAAFTPPGGPPRTAAGAMRTAFAKTVSTLARRLGSEPASWSWGRVHSRQFPSLTQAAALGYGPRPAPGDPWTIDAADGGMVSDFGPTWRMVINWTGPAEADSVAVYPGGQSDNPASAWYANLVPLWWDGRYLPLASAAGYRGGVTWTLRPEGWK